LHDRELGVAAARAVAGLARHSLRLGVGRTKALGRLAVSRDVAGQALGSFLWIGDAELLRHRLGFVGAQRLEGLRVLRFGPEVILVPDPVRAVAEPALGGSDVRERACGPGRT